LIAAHHCSDASIKVDDWRPLVAVDHGSNLPGPGLFILTKDMLIVINQNPYMPLGIVNEEATAVGFALHESVNVYSFGDTVTQYKPWFSQMPLLHAQYDKSTLIF